jgi:hypothetical protein
MAGTYQIEEEQMFVGLDYTISIALFCFYVSKIVAKAKKVFNQVVYFK